VGQAIFLYPAANTPASIILSQFKDSDSLPAVARPIINSDGAIHSVHGTIGTLVSPIDSALPDDAMLALARCLRAAVGCSWIALSPLRDGNSAGPRRTIDLTASQPSVLAFPADVIAATTVRILQVPGDRLPAGVPAGCRTYVLHPLRARADTIGLLELAWHEPKPDANLHAIDSFLPLAVLLADDSVVRGRVQELEARLERDLPYLRGELRGGGDLRTLTGEGPAMRAVRLAIGQVAQTDSNVLILGETGTGKELVARAIHQLSGRRERLLVAVNCAALAPSIIASELFGHEAGAFTGATRRRIGRFELAHRGTLFLDEIAELTPEVQVMLLRVLQERTVERVGGHALIAVDVRLIAATHQDLARAVHEGRFRADLFYRLNVFPIQVPPLRERPEDIPDLVRHFIHQFNRRLGKRASGINAASLDLLAGYAWPGNVRELQNLIERAMIIAGSELLHIEPSWLANLPASEAPSAPAPLHEVERRSILDALRRSHGRIYGPHGAAALLGIKPTTLYGKMRRHGIPRNG
jgi:formate hydrogenlyase transcriptional activator